MIAWGTIQASTSPHAIQIPPRKGLNSLRAKSASTSVTENGQLTSSGAIVTYLDPSRLASPGSNTSTCLSKAEATHPGAHNRVIWQRTGPGSCGACCCCPGQAWAIWQRLWVKGSSSLPQDSACMNFAVYCTRQGTENERITAVYVEWFQAGGTYVGTLKAQFCG